MSDFVRGDRCRFVKANHATNRILKGRVGDAGHVVQVIERASDGKKDCLVQFDESDKAYGRWWILADRLEPIASPK